MIYLHIKICFVKKQSIFSDILEVRQTLHRLLEDEDIDVQEWAEVALEILDLEE